MLTATSGLLWYCRSYCHSDSKLLWYGRLPCPSAVALPGSTAYSASVTVYTVPNTAYSVLCTVYSLVEYHSSATVAGGPVVEDCSNTQDPELLEDSALLCKDTVRLIRTPGLVLLAQYCIFQLLEDCWPVSSKRPKMIDGIVCVRGEGGGGL